MGCQFSCSWNPQNDLVSLAYHAMKKLHIFFGISRGKNRFLTSLGSDTIPSTFIPRDLDDVDMDDVLPSAGLFASTSQGTGQPRE